MIYATSKTNLPCFDRVKETNFSILPSKSATRYQGSHPDRTADRDAGENRSVLGVHAGFHPRMSGHQGMGQVAEVRIRIGGCTLVEEEGIAGGFHRCTAGAGQKEKYYMVVGVLRT